MTPREQVSAIVENTKDAYSVDRFRSWSACAAMLLKRGYTEGQAEGVLRSKWMRWALEEMNGLGPIAETSIYDDNGDYRLLPDGWLVIEHRERKCGGEAYCEYCAAQAEAELEVGR